MHGSRVTRPMAVALLAERRYLPQRQPMALAAELRRRGCDVTLVDSDSTAVGLTEPGWLDGVDVCVARGRSEAVLSQLLAAERHGVPTVNRRAAIAKVHDKAGMAVMLASAGVPTPPTSLGAPPQLAASLSPEDYPVVLKPVRGDNSEGLAVCESPAELASFESDRPVLAQPYLSGDGSDLKLYGVGERVWAVRKPSPLARAGSGRTAHEMPRGAPPVKLTQELRELALRCSALFSLELYGVDCLVTPAGPVVIEVNEFPNYTGIPEASAVLADYVLAAAQPQTIRPIEVAR
jgi:ribosomal protein S6--L-glutamate ligase